MLLADTLRHDDRLKEAIIQHVATLADTKRNTPDISTANTVEADWRNAAGAGAFQ